MPIRMLITGATGFIGHYLLEELAVLPNFEATLVTRPGSLANARPFKRMDLPRHVVECDIGEPDNVNLPHNEYDVVVNLVGPRTRKPIAQWESNVTHVKGLSALLKRLEVGRVVHASSVQVYGMPHQDRRITEESELSPTDLYGQTKTLSERLWVKFHSETGVPIVILRPTWVVGHGSRLIDKHLIAANGKGFKVVLDVKGPANIIYVRDVAEAFVRAATSESSGVQTYNLNTGAAVSVRAFCEAISMEMRQAKIPLTIPAPLLSLASQRFPFFKFLLSDVFVDGRKAENELAFSPRYDFTSMIRETVELMDQERRLKKS